MHRILVVDDYRESAEILCTLLESLGHTTRGATSGQAALAIAEVFDPDIAILDLDLPDISGLEVARELRVRFAGKPLYLAALTGSARPEDRERVEAAGIDCHVTKPATTRKLTEIVARAERAFASR